MIHNYYDTRASVKLNFNPDGSTRGNKFKLQKEMCRYGIRKYSFSYRVVNVWNSLLDYVLEADSVNSFKSRLDKYLHWANQEFAFNSELIGTGNYQSVCNGLKWYACMVCRCRHRGYT